MNREEYHNYISEEVFSGCKTIIVPLRLWRIKKTDPQKLAIYYIRKMQYSNSKTGKIHSYITQRLHMKLVQQFGIHISPNAQIGIGLHLPHPTSIVIGNSVVIGDHCSIYQGCTIGGARIGDVKKQNQPTIGDNCVLFSGSMVLGAINVVDGCTIAANSVLLNNANEPGVYAGSPARKVK